MEAGREGVAGAIVGSVRRRGSFGGRRIEFSSISLAHPGGHCGRFEVCDNASLEGLFSSIEYAEQVVHDHVGYRSMWCS